MINEIGARIAEMAQREIIDLRAQVETLTAERDLQERLKYDALRLWERTGKRLEAAEAENARLRTELVSARTARLERIAAGVEGLTAEMAEMTRLRNDLAEAVMALRRQVDLFCTCALCVKARAVLAKHPESQ